MKRFLLISVVAIFASFGANAQDILQKFYSNRISCKYSYTVKAGQFPLSYSGEALVQGDCYHLNGNGLEVFCDGKSRWTVDADAQEVYIENAEDVENMLLTFLKNSKDIKSTSTTLKGTFIDPLDGSEVAFALSDIKVEPKNENLSVFEFKAERLDNSYIVTDLRD